MIEENRIDTIFEEMKLWRHDFHKHPEIGYKEFRTSEIIASRLKEFGCDEVHSGIGVTGIVAVIHGTEQATSSDNAIMLRSDMDALPINEQNTFSYRSESRGVMHACGHDGHMSMLLGAARYLSENRHCFKGTVFFCFQPAEEGLAGALKMIDDGLFDRFDCRNVFGLHNWPGLEIGKVITRKGEFMASADVFEIKILSGGGHAARPEKTRDPMFSACQLVCEFSSIVARCVSPFSSALLSVPLIKSCADAANVISSEVMLSGTIRSFDSQARKTIISEMTRVCNAIEIMHEVKVELSFADAYYPVVVNDADLVDKLVPLMKGISGDDFDVLSAEKSMGSEDFAYMSQVRPSVFSLIGNGNSAGLHSDVYDFDDRALKTGVMYWVKLVKDLLPLS